MIVRLMMNLFAQKLYRIVLTFYKICSQRVISYEIPPSSFKIIIISNLVRRGIERPVFTYRSKEGSYFWVTVIGLQAQIKVVLAFKRPTTEAFAELTVCCYMASNKEF